MALSQWRDSRNTARAHFNSADRIVLLEQDTDKLENAIGGLATKEQVDSLQTTVWWMIGTFVGFILSIIIAFAALAFR